MSFVYNILQNGAAMAIIIRLHSIRFFTQMPSEHYMVEAKLILSVAADDIPKSDVIRTVIKDVWDIRTAKLRTSMDDFIKGDSSYAKLDHLTMLEIHSVRPLLTHSLDLIARLQRVRIYAYCCSVFILMARCFF